ncbi:hypothetical protein V2J94_39000 [Streptomyces sp. DSM 41524]|uniref:Uncharacterized protein n=1 Tax=Streptomyces asiaticus subsp. ignotus TaxID=3098222 RepID=A0ABU7Q8T4_9ACTN|nr:hypothetical protein [Streptomyces sp. DSM 41524]
MDAVIAGSASRALQEVVVSDIAVRRTPERGIAGRCDGAERSPGRVVRAWAGSAVLVGLTVPLAVASPAAAYDDPAHAYVADNSGDSVSVIDTRTNAVTTTIPVGDEPIGVAITPRTVAEPNSPNSPASS